MINVMNMVGLRFVLSCLCQLVLFWTLTQPGKANVIAGG